MSDSEAEPTPGESDETAPERGSYVNEDLQGDAKPVNPDTVPIDPSTVDKPSQAEGDDDGSATS
ncbi:MAG: hypothetical protein JWQ43_2788 [Glaciihabitans sp.]|nr:hypothetical protein [Glaciihabitans sp.]